MLSLWKKHPRLARALALLPIPILWCALAQLGDLKFLDNWLTDLRFRARGEIAAPVKVMYVDIDAKAINGIDNGTETVPGIRERPWNHSAFARAAEALLDAGHAKAIGFDLVLSTLAASDLVDVKKLAAANREFADVIKAEDPKIVLAAFYNEGGKGRIFYEHTQSFPYLTQKDYDRDKNDLPEMPQSPLITSSWGTVGLIDEDTAKSDAIPRWVPLFAETRDDTFYSLALELALLDLGLDHSAVHLHPDAIDVVRPDGSLAVSIPLVEHQLIEVNWFSHWGNDALNPHFSLVDVLANAAGLKSDKPEFQAAARRFFAAFADAVVLIGPTDPLLQDLAPTPFDAAPVPKVGLHGNLLKTIRSGLFLRRPPNAATPLLTFLLTAAVTGLAVGGGAKSLRNKVYAVAVLLAFALAAVVVFDRWQLILPMATPLLAAFTTSFTAVGWQLVAEEKQKGRIKGMFGTYVSPQLVERMVESGENPQLGGHDAAITAYFSDIQSFSTFSEVLKSGPLVELMNEYLTACTDIVQGEGGTLDKYIGDAVVAMFGAPIALPDHALRACIASQRVHLELGRLRAKWKSEGDKWPAIVGQMQTRVGLNTGVCMIGNMGSRTRFNYTMMGDNVNLAARMESGAKAYGVYTMVAEATKTACEQHGADRLVFRYLDKIVVKGRSIPVPIYEIVGLKENIADRTRECLATFSEGIGRYLAQDWDGAEALFRASATLEPNQPGQTLGVTGNPSLTLLSHCRHWRDHPPGPGWDGVYKMTEK